MSATDTADKIARLIVVRQDIHSMAMWNSSHGHYASIASAWVGYFGIGRCLTLSGIDMTVVHFGGR